MQTDIKDKPIANFAEIQPYDQAFAMTDSHRVQVLTDIKNQRDVNPTRVREEYTDRVNMHDTSPVKSADP